MFGARRNPATALDRRDERVANYYLDWAFDEMKKLVGDVSKVDARARVRGAHRRSTSTCSANAENGGREFDAPVRQRIQGASQAAAVVIDSTARCARWSAAATTAQSQFNRATDAMRQPGSSFKPYVYATALTNGFKPTSIVVDAPICIGNWCPQNYGHGFSGSMTLTQAITRSINIIPVRLSVSLGNGNQRSVAQRSSRPRRRWASARRCRTTPSLPIGAAEVTVLDHTGAYATFPNLGKAVTPHAILEVRSGTGELVWRFDRDGKKPRQVMRAAGRRAT